jgi:glutamate synthase (NADPH/NADH) small chain
MLGHAVTIYDARPKPGGLNEYGIASYKTPGDFAQAEVDWLMRIGGITIENGKALGRDMTLYSLQKANDAVLLAMGLGGVNALNAEGESISGARDAVDFIAELRQTPDKSKLPIGRDVVVIGGGMTAVDAAVQSKLLGAEEVTICYRRGQDAMGASPYEQDLAASKGVNIRHWLAPKRVLAEAGRVTGIEMEYTELRDGKLVGIGHTMTLPADQVFKAIGQTLSTDGEGVTITGGKNEVDAEGRTSMAKVWAGGDCATGGDDLTVTAVAEGRDAAEDIDAALRGPA